MEHTSGKAPRTSRPVDVACFGCFHPAQASTSARSGHEAALGTPLRHRSPDTCAGPSRSFGAFGRARHTRQAAETLWALSGAAQRAPLRTGQALSGRQEGRLNPHEDSERGSFARGFISSPKLSCLKRKLSLPFNYEGLCDESYVHRKTPAFALFSYSQAAVLMAG